jgi:hypothetical protein
VQPEPHWCCRGLMVRSSTDRGSDMGMHFFTSGDEIPCSGVEGAVWGYCCRVGVPGHSGLLHALWFW